MKILKNNFFIVKEKNNLRSFIQIWLILILVSPLVAQENISLVKEQELEDYTYYRKSLIPMFLYGSYQFGIIDYKDSNKIALNSSFNINFEIHGNISFKPRLYTAFFYAKTTGIFSLHTNPKLKAVWGVSGYVYNARNKESKLGWSIMMGAGGTIHFDMENNTTYLIVSLDHGYEFFLRGQYNFHKYVGFIIGFSFEHLLIVDDLWGSFDNSYNNINKFNLGMTVGLAF